MKRIAPFVAIAVLLVVAAPASAHQDTLVANKFHFLVGWGDEPAYSGLKNSVQLTLTDSNRHPVADLSDELKVEVTTGKQKVTLPMEPNFAVGEYGEPGDYRGWIVPTRPGTYSFHFTGSIHDTPIDETFTSSDTTFDDIKAVTEAQFPVKDPSAGDLSQRVQKSEARLTAAANKAKDDAGKARSIATLAVVIGAAGIGLGIVGLTRKR